MSAVLARVDEHVAARVTKIGGWLGSSASADDATGVQLVVVDLDQLGGVLGDVAALGDDERDRVADQPDLVGGQDRERRRRHPRHHRQGRRAGREQRLDVVAGVDGDDAGSARASSTSTRVMLACATVLRTNAACSMPGSWMSST